MKDLEYCSEGHGEPCDGFEQGSEMTQLVFKGCRELPRWGEGRSGKSHGQH